MPKIKTDEDIFCIEKTMEHKLYVKGLMNKVAKIIEERGEKHDNSKLEEPEFSLFSKHTSQLAKLTYGSLEYKKALEDLRPALVHHYANNRHHTEYYKNGIKEMNFIDLIEMTCDWYGATKRHENGNIYESLKINKSRFSISDDLIRIIENTVRLIESINR
jgi:hypothetical protein